MPGQQKDCVLAQLCVQLRQLEEEEAGRTLGRRALSSALADSDERLKTLAIELAALARAL
jgi:hypothetical protein